MLLASLSFELSEGFCAFLSQSPSEPQFTISQQSLPRSGNLDIAVMQKDSIERIELVSILLTSAKPI